MKRSIRSHSYLWAKYGAKHLPSSESMSSYSSRATSGSRRASRGIVSLLFQALFYTVGVYSTLVLLGLEPFSLSEFVGSLMPLNRKAEWFLPTYLSLMIFSPLLRPFR